MSMRVGRVYFGYLLGLGVVTHLTTPLVYALLALSAAAGWQVALALGIGFGLGRSLLAVAGAVLVDRGRRPRRDLDPDHHAGCRGSVGGRRERARRRRGRALPLSECDPTRCPAAEYRSSEGCGHPSLRARCGCAPPFRAARVDCPCPRSAGLCRCRRRERCAVRVGHPPQAWRRGVGHVDADRARRPGADHVHRDQSRRCASDSDLQARRHQPRHHEILGVPGGRERSEPDLQVHALDASRHVHTAAGRGLDVADHGDGECDLTRHARPGRVDRHRERGRRPDGRSAGDDDRSSVLDPGHAR